MENKQLGIVFDEEEVVGQVIGEANANASDVCNRPSIKRFGEPHALVTEFGWLVEQGVDDIPKGPRLPSETSPRQNLMFRDPESHHHEKADGEVEIALACFFGCIGGLQRIHDLLSWLAVLDILHQLSNCPRRPAFRESENVPLVFVIVTVSFMTEPSSSIAVEKLLVIG